MTISFKTSDDTQNKLKEFYEDLKREKTPAYAVFQANDGDTVVTLYESGKIVFQGKDADLASQFWVETEKMNNKNVEINNSENKTDKDKKEIIVDPKIYNSTSIGSDEVGTGDYFGPIVVTAAYVKKEDIPYLEKLGVNDSKKVDDNKILQIVPELIKKIEYKSIILSNKEYNEMYSSDMNMNKVKAILHNKVLNELTKDHQYDYVVVDQFAKPFVYYNYLKQTTNVFRKITFMTKAESKCLSVACASMISRYIFLKEFDKLSNKMNTFLLKGAGTSVDELGAKIVKKHGFNILNEIAKLNFKNTEKINDIIKKEI
ncbi:MAG: ribonuclease HIII [Bacilli bacterium]|nr:ribonuclease HIII [Bacilli bacterium]